MSKAKSVSKDRVVSIHYTLTDADGTKLESSVGEEPLKYLHGHKQLIVGLEKALKGKVVGDKLKVKVSPSEGYGDYDENLVTTVKKSQFKDQKKIKVGDIFQMKDSEGEVLVVRVTGVVGEDVVIDSNHPLAGKDLKFNVEIVEIRDATKEEIAHGHAH